MLKRTLLEWFLIVYFFALLVRGIWFILHLPPLGIIFALSLLALLVWCVWQFKNDEKRAEAREKRLGYRVTYITPNTLGTRDKLNLPVREDGLRAYVAKTLVDL